MSCGVGTTPTTGSAPSPEPPAWFIWPSWQRSRPSRRVSWRRLSRGGPASACTRRGSSSWPARPRRNAAGSLRSWCFLGWRPGMLRFTWPTGSRPAWRWRAWRGLWCSRSGLRAGPSPHCVGCFPSSARSWRCSASACGVVRRSCVASCGVVAGDAVILVGMAAPWMVWQWTHTGAWLPATASAKAAFYAEQGLPLWVKLRLIAWAVGSSGISLLWLGLAGLPRRAWPGLGPGWLRGARGARNRVDLSRWSRARARPLPVPPPSGPGAGHGAALGARPRGGAASGHRVRVRELAVRAALGPVLAPECGPVRCAQCRAGPIRAHGVAAWRPRAGPRCGLPRLRHRTCRWWTWWA